MFTNEKQQQLLNALSQDLTLMRNLATYVFKVSANDFDGVNRKWFQVIEKARVKGYEVLDKESISVLDSSLQVEIVPTEHPQNDFLNAMDAFTKYRSTKNFADTMKALKPLYKKMQETEDLEERDRIQDEITKINQSIIKTSTRFKSGSVLDILEEDYIYEEDAGRIPTYIPELDDVLGDGFYKNGCHIISAEPHNGKTTLAVQLATAQATHNYKVLYLTLEQLRVDILENVFSVLSEENEEDRSFFERGKAADAKDMAKKRDIGRELLYKYTRNNLIIDDTPFQSVQELIDRVMYAIIHENVQIIYVDNFQNAKTVHNATVELTHLADVFKDIAREYGVPIVNLSQITVDSKGNEKTKFTSVLNDNAVTQLKVYRQKPKEDDEEDDDGDLIYINIKKNRKGRGFLKEDLSFIFNADKSVIGFLDLPKRTSEEMFIAGIEEDAEKIIYQGEELPF
ncbi:DnaB-like helicase C-terminal domain-containing protein [Priestia megaterium]